MNRKDMTRAMLRAAIASMSSIAAAYAHADASCDAVYDAGLRQLKTPHHIYSSHSANGKDAQASETIFASGVVYMQIGGRWQRSPITADEMQRAAEDKRDAGAAGETCRRLGDETVAGAIASVYGFRNADGVESKFWIAQADGMLLRQTIALPDGTTIDNRYEYANVQAPAGVR